MRFFPAAALALLLCGCQTPYGDTGSMGGVKVFEISPGKVEIMVMGSNYTSYDKLARIWKTKADEAARLRGATQYKILRFSTGRELMGVEVMGENSFVERYSGDTNFWFPKIARGVILLLDAVDAERRNIRRISEIQTVR